MKKLLLILSICLIPTFSGCTTMKSVRDTANSWVAQKPEDMGERVVYTPLLESRTGTDPKKMEVLLRPPARTYKEIGLISMYRKYSDETAATLLPAMRERAAKEGANAILLTEIADKPIGTQTSASAVPIGDVMFANSVSTPLKEGTIHGIAIIYEP